uniref:CCHC-type domain-containing protein n=1 Tax=Hippocampus comes TaxID=109280 RepID=A0A3Q2XB38_HIPCM
GNVNKIKTALSSQGQLVDQQGQAHAELREAVSMLAHRLDNLRSWMEQASNRGTPSSRSPTVATEIPSPPIVGREPNFPHPHRYGGKPGLCKQFLHQCSLIFDQQPSAYEKDSTKVAFVMSLLTGQAAAWAVEISNAQPGLRSSFPEFVAEFRRVFHHPVMGREAEGRLLAIRQGKQSVAEYSISFRILAARSGYGDHALCGLFRRGLNVSLKDELATRDDSTNLEELINLALVLDNRMREREQERERERGDERGNAQHHPGTGTADAEGEPMQLGGGRLGPEERQRRIRDQACFYCGQPGHRVANCSMTPAQTKLTSSPVGASPYTFQHHTYLFSWLQEHTT